MAGYTLFQSGVTGPSANIGGSDEYHIDSKFSTSMGIDQARRLFEEKVRRYRELGRDVEFSNSAVSGLIYDLDLPEEQRADIFRRATSAHAPRQGWYSLDYYAPHTGKGRYHESAEGAPIFAVAPEGGRRETGTADNYGFYSTVFDADGNLIAKVGHGDNRYPSTGDGTSITGAVPAEPSTSTPNPGEQTVMSPAEVNAKYDQMRMAGDALGARNFGMKEHLRLFGKR